MSILPHTDAQQQYKYFAFISYSSKDMAWGRQLQHKLERYRLPARLASKRKGAPNRAYPIFRDETDGPVSFGICRKGKENEKSPFSTFHPCQLRDSG
jgi:hypothetical protein